MLEIRLWRLLRTLLGITLDEVAACMRCTKQTVSNIELGKGSSEMSKFMYITMMKILVNRESEEAKQLAVDLRTLVEFLEEA